MNTDTKATHYFEAHITLEPVFGEDLERARRISKHFGFKVASLLMQKRAEDTPEQSKFDTFTTGHGKSLNDITERVRECIVELQAFGFKVWRYKIEDTVLDSRIIDNLGLFNKEAA